MKYRYIGEGKGVPGLPHELDDTDVRQLGVERLLADALKSNTYEAEKTATEKPAVQKKTKKRRRYSAQNKEA